MAVTNRQPGRAARLFEDIISSPNLVGLWLLNETSGTIYDRALNRMDSTSNNGNPVYSNLMTIAYGVNFDGTGDYFGLGNQTPLSFERTDTFSGLVLCNPNVSAANAIISKWDAAAGRGWHWGLSATVKPLLILQNTATTNLIEVDANAALTNGTDVMLGFSYSGSSAASGVTLYKNGVSDASTAVTDTLSATIANTSEAQIGARAGSLTMNGKLAMLAIWNKVVSAEDFRRYGYLSGFL